jgi:Helix-hairpin-helix motif
VLFTVFIYRRLFYFAADSPVPNNQNEPDVIQPGRKKNGVDMNVLRWGRALAFSVLTIFVGCNQQPSPQEIKQKTAEATAEAKNDVKAVGEGLREGWNNHNALDLNTATSEQLQSLPGVSAREADRVIAARPYEHPDDLVSRHIMSQAEYDKIADRVTARK